MRGDEAKRQQASRAILAVARRMRKPKMKDELIRMVTGDGVGVRYIRPEIEHLIDVGMLVEHGIKKAANHRAR